MTAFRLFRSARSPDTDGDLLARFVASRDEAAFAELLHRHGPLVYRVCRRLLDASTADDAFQATFLVLATRANRVRKAASVGSWLIGVAGRVARQTRRRTRLPAPLRVAANQAGEMSQLETAELGAALDDELTRLPDALRAAAVECLVNEKTQADAAKALGESERTVRRRVAEARRLLRERLERRGVVPAVTVGLVASIGTAAAVPLRLSNSTVSVVFDFLAGGAAVASAPAVLAKGVAMSGLRKTLAASVAALAVGFSMLGLSMASDGPKPSEPLKAEAKTIPPQNVPVGGKEPAQPPRPAVQSPPLFVVTGGDAVVNRAVQREAEYQARVLAEKWTGKPFPTPAEPYPINIKIDPGKVGGATTFTFGKDQPKLTSVTMQLTGGFEQLLRVNLPHEVAHVVLAAHFGRPLPRWADEGIAILNEPAKDQADHDVRCRELTNAGRAIRVKHLLPMTEYPRDIIVLYAQGHSLARFLHERDPKKLLPLIEASFADGWDQALKATYGFKDADELEEAWLAWLRKPETLLKAAAKPGLPAYVIEAPDILRIAFAPKPDGAPKSDEYMVRPDGTVGLGLYGNIAVAGKTLAEATDAVRKELAKFQFQGEVTLDVAAFNSKVYYVVTDGGGGGEQVQRLPCTGNETVLDALARAGANPGAKQTVWVARPGANGGKEQILPVDWNGISAKGDVKTNYQLLPGDRVHVMTK